MSTVMPTSPHQLSARSGRATILELRECIVEHAHPNAQVLIKLEGPDSSFVVAGHDHPVRDDTLITINPWVPHQGPAHAVIAPTRILTFDIELPGESGSGRLNARTPVFDQVGSSLAPDLRERARQLCDRLVRGVAKAEELDAMIEVLLARYSGHMLAPAESQRIDFRIRRVLRQMEGDPAVAQDMAICASTACLSRSHFFHLFREGIGVSPQLFANGLRLEAAIECLRDPSQSIGAVAEQLGFSAAGHFTRFFVHHTGSTPRDYRRGAAR